MRLFADYLDVEMKYVKDTGIYPIMHAIALKREIVERNPWVAVNLFKAFDEARRRSVERALNWHELDAAAAVGLRVRASACRTSSART